MAYDPSDLGKWVDVTDEIMVVPNKWGLFQQLGIFSDEPLSGKTVMIPRVQWEEALVPDRAWGARASNPAGQARGYITISVPHFPHDEAILPSDLDGKVSWEDLFEGVVVESLEATRARKMEQLRKNHSITLEYARAQLINAGTVYAPNGTLATSYGSTYNMYTEHGVTRNNFTIGLGTLTRDPLQDIEAWIAGTQDEIQNGAILDAFVCICSTGFFNQLVNHPFVTEKYTYDNSARARELLTGRMTADQFGLDARYRTFEFGGVIFVEYRGSFDGTPYIDANEARFFPLTDEPFFKTFYAPADKFGIVNTQAQQVYMWEYPSPKADKIEIESEQNFLNWCLYPKSVSRVTITSP